MLSRKPKLTRPRPEIKADETKPDAKAEEPKPEAKASSDLTPQIAARAYELYAERAGNDATAVQDWKKAEQEIRNDEAKVAPKPEAKAGATTPQAKADPKPDAAAEPKPEAKDMPQPDVSPQLVKRVHEAYEELGRKDVQSVQDWEKAHAVHEEHDAHK